MVEDTFQLTRVNEMHSNSWSFDKYVNRDISRNSSYTLNPYSTFPNLPSIYPNRSDSVLRPLHSRASTSIAVSAFEIIPTHHTRTNTAVSTVKVTPSLIKDLKSSISKSFDRQIVHDPEALSLTISRLSKKSTAQKQIKSLEAKMLRFRRKHDSLEKERLLKAEKLASLMDLHQSLMIQGTPHALVDRAGVIEVKIAHLMNEYGAEKSYTQVLQAMEKKREIAKKFCLIRNDKLKESLNRLNHQIKEAGRSLLSEQAKVQSFKSQITRLISGNLNETKVRQTEIKTTIDSYREDLEIEHHIEMNQVGISLGGKIRKNDSRLQLLMKAEHLLRSQEKFSMNLSLHDAYQTDYEKVISKLQKATQTTDAESVVTMYNAILHISEELAERKAATEAKLLAKKELLIMLRQEREATLAGDDFEFISDRYKLENQINERNLEVSSKESAIESTNLWIAQVINGLYQLTLCAHQVSSSKDALVASTDIPGICVQLGKLLAPIVRAFNRG